MPLDFLSMKNISKSYEGVLALDAVDFSIIKGEIHCLAGTNGSGKSTLIKIISGIERPSPGGTVVIEGKVHHSLTAIDSIKHGIEVIYQDLSLFPNLSVAENIALSTMVFEKRKVFSLSSYNAIAKKSMQRIDVNLPLDIPVGKLSVSEQQLVAICRAMTSEVKLLIMDEPTTALTAYEIDRLLSVVTDLKSHGISTLFVSHKLQEIIKVADRVTILRDSKKIGCFPVSELDSSKIEFYMTGKNFKYSAKSRLTQKKEPVIEVKNYSKKGNFRDISFSVYPGEILGITGLLGSGRTELALSLFGMNHPEEGVLLLDGKRINPRSAHDAVRYGIGYVPENRLVQGLIMQQSVAKNAIATIIDSFSKKLSLLDPKLMDQTINKLMEEFNVKIPNKDSAISTLSGGNQQKVVLAKWVATQPRILILDGPTVGIDIAAKGAIHEFIKKLAEQGLAIIVISDEVPEVYNLSHRVIVMNKGVMVHEFITTECGEDDLASYLEHIS